MVDDTADPVSAEGGPLLGWTEARRSGWRIAFLVLCTLGLCFSADLLRLHVNVHTDPVYHSYCAISPQVNCETVAASEYSVFLGLPLALWGLVGYLSMGALGVWGLRRRRPAVTWPFGLLFWPSAFSVSVSVILFLVSHFLVEAVCIVCTGTYAVNAALLVTAALELRRLRTWPQGAAASELQAVMQRPRPFLTFGAAVVAVVAAVWVAVPAYWRFASSTGPAGLRVGLTKEGHPWLGATEPALTIVEFSDYQCSHCRQRHAEMRELTESHPDRVRLVHRHYPIDEACNPRVTRPRHRHACQYARMAFCAGEQGRFWEANDYLFSHGRRRTPVTSRELAPAAGVHVGVLETCMDSQTARHTVQEDMAEARSLGVRGTPTFIVDGTTYPGRLPPDIIDKALGARTASAPEPASNEPGPPTDR